MIQRIATFRVRPETVAEAIAAIETFVAAVAQRESGTLDYSSYRFTDADGTEFVHMMSFVDTEARDRHKTSSHVEEFVGRLYPLCIEEPRFRDIELVSWNRVGT